MKHFRLSKPVVQVVTLTTAVVVGIIMVWATWRIVRQPDIGVLWSQDGTIFFAKRDSPFQVGDQLLTIDNVPAPESVFPYYFWQEGDIVRFELMRSDERLVWELPYVEKAPPLILMMRLSVVIVAFAFWVMGTIIAFFLPLKTKQAVLFFLSCQIIALSLAFGNVTSRIAHLSIVLTWWSVPISIHFHLLFPFNRITKYTRKIIIAAYVIPIFSLIRILLALDIITILPPDVNALYTSLFYMSVLVGLSMMLGLLSHAYYQAPSTTVKRQVGLILICGFLSLTPLITLSILPQLLLGEMLIPPQFTLLFLVGIPIGYGYAITKYQFIKLERYISRGTTIVLVIGVICSIYLGITAFLQAMLPTEWLSNPLVNLVTIMSLVVAYNPLRRRLQNFVDYLFYGGWYDYPSVVGEITHTLEKATDIRALVETLSHSIQKTMRVYWACLLLPNPKTKDSVVVVSGQVDKASLFEGLQLDQLKTITAYLQQHFRPTASREIQAGLLLESLSLEENKLLNYSLVRLWVPIHGRNSSTGVLLLGPKFGGDVFDSVDMEILEVISRQASIAFQNAQLITELEEKARENERYQKEIIRTRDEERKRISHELHDQIIQTLVGFKYQIANIQTSLNLSPHHVQNSGLTTYLLDQIQTLIQTTRSLCYDLRPPALDLGLIPSIRSLASHFERESGIIVTLTISGDRNIKIHEDIALCIFQCTKEAISNIRKHAVADSVHIELEITPASIRFVIEDNGHGFAVPERLGSLMEQNHFGLVGMRERLELVHGTLQIISAPYEGTRICASIPFLISEGT